MKQRLKWILIVMVLSAGAEAKTVISIEPFEDQTKTGCAHLSRKSDLAQDMQNQLSVLLANYEDLTVVEPGAKNAPQYKVEGAVKACPTHKGGQAKISIEIRVLEIQTGAIALTYNTNARASGSRSNLALATKAALTEIAFRIDRAVLRPKPSIHVESDQPSDYRVELVKAERITVD